MARVYESKAEFRSALQHEKEGYTIYKNQVQPTIYVRYIGPAKMFNDALSYSQIKSHSFWLRILPLKWLDFACEIYKYEGFIYKYKANLIMRL